MLRLLTLAPLPALLAALAIAGCGGGETVEPLPETVQGEIPQATLPEGDAEAGATIYDEQACGSCHTYGPAGSSAEVGPNLDESLEGKDAEYIRSSIVAPDAQIAEGFAPGIMPKDYGEKLEDQQLADLVAFLQQ